MPGDGDGLLVGVVAVQAGGVLSEGDGGAGLARRYHQARVGLRPSAAGGWLPGR